MSCMVAFICAVNTAHLSSSHSIGVVSQLPALVEIASNPTPTATADAVQMTAPIFAPC